MIEVREFLLENAQSIRDGWWLHENKPRWSIWPCSTHQEYESIASIDNKRLCLNCVLELIGVKS